MSDSGGYNLEAIVLFHYTLQTMLLLEFVSSFQDART